jgi:hypothetical protein
VAISNQLANRYYDIYKIDKQRRLLRIDTLTPRAIKDMKYQGSLIIIPYVSTMYDMTTVNIDIYNKIVDI